MLGSKLPRSEVGFCRPPVASRTLRWTYSASSSAVTTPSWEVVGLPLQALHHVVGEDAVAAAPVRALVRHFAVAAGGHRKQAFVGAEQLVVDGLDVGIGVDGAAMAGVGEQNLPFALYLGSEHPPQLLHRIPGGVDMFGIDVVGRQIPLAPVHETVAGEIDQHAIVVAGNRRQPSFELAA